MVPEAKLTATDDGLAPVDDGWFVLNARAARWRPGQGRGAYCRFEGEPEFSQVGIHLVALEPGDPMAMYHWEADQEDFLVLAGEALLIIEGEERRLRLWDFVHCPAGTKHVIVGAGDAPCLVLAVGARDQSTGQTGAATRWTRSRCTTAPASSRRPPIRSRRGRDFPNASLPATATAGYLSSSFKAGPGVAHKARMDATRPRGFYPALSGGAHATSMRIPSGSSLRQLSKLGRLRLDRRDYSPKPTRESRANRFTYATRVSTSAVRPSSVSSWCVPCEPEANAYSSASALAGETLAAMVGPPANATSMRT